jgi:hypothetical protein
MNDTATFTPPSTPNGWLQKHRNLLTGLLLMLAAWLIYLPSVRFGFVYYDDVRILLDHPELYGQPSFTADLKEIFTANFPREEPLLLRDVSWALDSRIFGFGNAFGYHLGNVLLHGVVTALMFVFLLGSTRRYGMALIVSLAFLLVGIHTEPVDWIMGRKDILSTLFMLLALCAQTRRLTTENIPAQCGWYLAAWLCFAAGLLSKISVLTFPAVMFLHAIFLPYLRGEQPPGAGFVSPRIWLRELALMLPAMIFSVVIFRWYSRTLGEMGIMDRGYTAHGMAHLWNLLMVDPLVIVAYVQQTFCPRYFAVFYPWPNLESTYPVWQIITSVSIVLLTGVAGLALFFRRKDLFFYFSTFFVLMVPYLNLKFMGIWVADRYLYFSVFCLLAIVVTVAGEFYRRPQPGWRRGILAVGLGFASLNVYQTFSYQPAWQDGGTLWQYHLVLPHAGPESYGNLGAYYYAEATAHQGTPAMGVAINKVATVVKAGLAQFWPDHQQPPPPGTSFLFFLQSLVEQVQGDPEKALASLLTSDELHPHFDSTQLNLARLYHLLAGQTSEPHQRQTYEMAARDRLQEYIRLVYRGRPATPELQAELAGYIAAANTAEPTNHTGLNTAH